eukprot:TRINITY_DN3203_c2_g1_i1.p2 TRINITY_DN3203_c2_g1~~TRINITY_DN3203_c2_g1_i1.p2  ORF type:complete len:362 (+),score=121.18 TRINITY_DN3203_c2_g1_i1:160-1245(+)
MSSKSEEKNEFDFKPYELKALKGLIGAMKLEGFELSSTMCGDIKVYKLPRSGSVPGVCGHSVVDASAEEIFAEITNPVAWKAWDSLMKESELHPLDNTHKMINLRFHPIWPFSSRDTCTLETRARDEDGNIYIASTGVNHPTIFPVVKDYVRAQVDGGGWVISPVKDNPHKCHVVYYMSVDLRLSLVPNWAVTMIVSRFPKVINTMRGILQAKVEARKKKEQKKETEKEKEKEKENDMSEKEKESEKVEEKVNFEEFPLIHTLMASLEASVKASEEKEEKEETEEEEKEDKEEEEEKEKEDETEAEKESDNENEKEVENAQTSSGGSGSEVVSTSSSPTAEQQQHPIDPSVINVTEVTVQS